MFKAVPGDRAVVIEVDPGIPVGLALNEFPRQRFTDIWLSRRADGDWRPPDANLPFGALDQVTASELIRDLTDVTAPRTKPAARRPDR